MRISKKEQERLDRIELENYDKVHRALNSANNKLRMFLKDEAEKHGVPLEPFSFYLLLSMLNGYREEFKKVTIEHWD